MNTASRTGFGTASVNIRDLNRRAMRQECQPSPEPSRTKDEDQIQIVPEYETICRLIEQGNPVVFVTGNAGTGKTVLVRHLREKLNLNLAVVAPTGVAALNVQGMTIHAFFQFPPKIMEDKDIKKIEDRKLFRKLQLLIIDEISMVRADIIDSIDKFLRRNRESDRPFGGVQLLLIGDLFQLPPVVLQSEKRVLERKGYSSPYFFSAFSFQKLSMTPVELNTFFRQEDLEFIKLLNQVRVAEDVENTVNELNRQCHGKDGDEYSETTLTGTNQAADQINIARLKSIDSQEYQYEGKKSGNFNMEEDKLPSPINLKLKVGARVMFTKNDNKKRWVNGTIGVVEELGSESIRVRIESGEKNTICDVLPENWENYSYKYNKDTDRIEAVKTGEYVQYPLMLAWAVTIHKSQGRTLENVMIDFGKGAFACGQAYVALSRCRKIDGIRLKRKVRGTDIQCDPVIARFYEALREMSE